MEHNALTKPCTPIKQGRLYYPLVQIVPLVATSIIAALALFFSYAASIPLAIVHLLLMHRLSSDGKLASKLERHFTGSKDIKCGLLTMLIFGTHCALLILLYAIITVLVAVS